MNRSHFSFYFKLARNLFYSIVERRFLHDFCFLNSLIVPFLFILNWYEIYFTRRKKIFARFSIFVFSKFVNRSHFSFYFKLARNLFYSIVERRFFHWFLIIVSQICQSFCFSLSFHSKLALIVPWNLSFDLWLLFVNCQYLSINKFVNHSALSFLSILNHH